jgi:uncharacterized protein YdiU (UPF0061 family)
MDIKDKIKTVLKDTYGEFTSFLETEYEVKLTEKLSSNSITERKIWATYNQIIIEVKCNQNNDLILKELLYILTENEINNESILFVIDKIENKTKETDRLFNKIKNF